tara:strand:+ start:65 stop:778 length:714 start_codon:yes stop_codon:yes gene_type:complete
MKIFDDIELIDLAVYVNKTLIVTDFHIGYEESLNKQGLMVPRFQFDEIMKRLEKIFSRLKGKKIDKIIVNGDLKHEFSTISDQEWRHTLKLLDFFEKHCNEIILIKGNHDTILGPIAKKRNIRVMDHFIINNILIIHGDVIPSKTLLKGVKTIIIGHEHPAVSVREGPRAELFKAFLVGKWKKYNLVVQPSFNLVTEGTDVLKEEVLIPFLKGNLRNLNAIIVGDKLYNFGKIKDLN